MQRRFVERMREALDFGEVRTEPPQQSPGACDRGKKLLRLGLRRPALGGARFVSHAVSMPHAEMMAQPI